MTSQFLHGIKHVYNTFSRWHSLTWQYVWLLHRNLTWYHKHVYNFSRGHSITWQYVWLLHHIPSHDIMHVNAFSTGHSLTMAVVLVITSHRIITWHHNCLWRHNLTVCLSISSYYIMHETFSRDMIWIQNWNSERIKCCFAKPLTLYASELRSFTASTELYW